MRLSKIGRDDRGATAVEYGLILALVFLAMVTSVQHVGHSIIATWNTVSTNFANAAPSS